MRAAAWVRSARGARPPCAGGHHAIVSMGEELRRGRSRIWRLILALKPNDDETFSARVDEELRRDQMKNFVSATAGWLIAGVVLRPRRRSAAGSGGSTQQEAKAGEQGETLIAALDDIEARQPQAAAAPKLDAARRSDIDGYRAAALFARPTAQIEAGNAPRARSRPCAPIADDEESRRDLSRRRAGPADRARIRHAAAAGGDRPAEGRSPWPGNPWFGSAGEMVGIAYLKLNRPDQAGADLRRASRRTRRCPTRSATRATRWPARSASSATIGTDAAPAGRRTGTGRNKGTTE